MIVVAILGILATIAVPTFLRMRERAKIAEAKANLGGIRVCEIGYYAEYSRYIGNQGYTPDRTADPPARYDWDPNTRFSMLGFAPEGTVRFSYRLAGIDEPADGFTATAMGDLDGNGVWSYWETSDKHKVLTHTGDDF